MVRIDESQLIIIQINDYFLGKNYDLDPFHITFLI